MLRHLRRTLLAAALILLAAAAPASAVSGGTDANPATYPFIASIGGFCTGTLIAPDRVLTAGHCLAFQLAASAVKFGVSNPAAKVPAHAVKGVAVDPQFREQFPFSHATPESATAVDDVGVIILAKPVTDVTPVPIATAADAAALEQPGLGVSLLGYGPSRAPFKLPPNANFGPPSVAPLQIGQLSLISDAQCLVAYPKAIVAGDICSEDLANDPTPVVGCPGDSGGPLLAPGPNGPVEIGITSWGLEVKNFGCGKARLPDVDMRVSNFTTFITNPHPILAPRTTTLPTITGAHTLTCHAPAFTGSKATLSYQWAVATHGYARIPANVLDDNPVGPKIGIPVKPLRGATGATFTVGTARTHGQQITCAATATNASGSWTAFAHETVSG
jgi:secreted trypsin-like serine protease